MAEEEEEEEDGGLGTHSAWRRKGGLSSPLLEEEEAGTEPSLVELRSQVKLENKEKKISGQLLYWYSNSAVALWHELEFMEVPL